MWPVVVAYMDKSAIMIYVILYQDVKICHDIVHFQERSIGKLFMETITRKIIQ